MAYWKVKPLKNTNMK